MTKVILATFFLVFTSNAISQAITVTNTFVDGQTASAAEVNQNFTDLATKVNAIVRKDDTLFNTATGAFAINPNITTTGTNDTANGYDALYNLTTGSNNTAVGFEALRANTGGNHNTASGSQALLSNIGGNLNTASGYQALFENTEGGANTASGSKALFLNTTGNFNTASGSFSLFSNTVGDSNTASGYSTLFNNITGEKNTASGYEALFNNTGGSRNTASGHQALYTTTTGTNNTASGVQRALRQHHRRGQHRQWSPTRSTATPRAGNNTASGYFALRKQHHGHRTTPPVASKRSSPTPRAASTPPVAAQRSNVTSTGEYNTAFGYAALYANTDGQQQHRYWLFADVTSSALTNATAIGYSAKVNASNKVRIGNTAVTVIEGEVAFSASSDARLKENITVVDAGLALVNDLNPVSYHRINSSSDDIEMGLLAQEVEEVLAAHGLSNSGMVHQASEDAYRSVRYNDLLAPMIRAIQELDDAAEAKDQQIASLQEQLTEQQESLLAMIATQQEQIVQLQNMVNQQFATR